MLNVKRPTHPDGDTSVFSLIPIKRKLSDVVEDEADTSSRAVWFPEVEDSETPPEEAVPLCSDPSSPAWTVKSLEGSQMNWKSVTGAMSACR